MHKHHGPPDTSKGYEQSDLSISDILKGVIGFFAFTGVMGVAGVGIVWALGGLGWKDEAPRPMPPAPNPLLQSDASAKVDIWNLRYKEEIELGTYGPSTAKAGAQRIPIDKAMDLVAEQGLKSGGRTK